MPRLEVTLFGTFQAVLDGSPLTSFRSVNTQGLFAYLIMQAERPFPRETLATLFWPDVPDSTAKKNLRQTLYQLRQLLEKDSQAEPYLRVSRQNVQWNTDSDFVLDVQAFLTALEHGALETAVSHYHGELLPGFTCDSLEFESWLRLERERLQRLALTALDDLTERQLTQADFAAAQVTAGRQLALEPWREPAHRQLMRALALAGDRSAALAQFDRCQQILAEELGAQPERETTNLAAQIEAGAFGRDDDSLIAGQYELGEPIGQGAMGTVYRGRHQLTGQLVAIKMLDRSRVAGNPELVERFRREGEALRRLAHPNIVQLLATDEKEGHHYLVMELVEGGDLLEYLRGTPQPPLQDVFAIGLDLADALTRAHHLDILHRDIKPANVLLDLDGRPKLTDFGIARLGEMSTLTQHGAVLGTVAYLSPEACQGEPLDERADIWALGLLLYEMLAGERPFARPTSAATLMAILQEPTPDIRRIRQDLPPALTDLLGLMLQKDKTRRIRSVRQVGAAFETLLKAHKDGSAADLVLNIPPPTEDSFLAEIQRSPTFTGPFQAPNKPPHFVGREAALVELADLFQQHQVLALVGMGGIGKTSLAAAFAHECRTQFADGILWANTHNSEPGNILELWGRAYDHDFSGLTDVASRETAVRGLLAEKQTLLVLDNVDDAAQARPLLLPGAQGAVLLTTRSLDVASALNAETYIVPELNAHSSMGLLVEILGEKRVQAKPEEAAAAGQICALLSHLPLAVEIAAQRLKSRPRLTLAALAERLQNTQQRLGLAISDSAVRASFEVSWEALDEGLQTLFAQLAVFDGRPFTVEAIAAIADWNLYLAEDDLYTLATLSLVQEFGETRFKQHPLLADFAAEKLGDDDEANGRMVQYFLKFARENQENFEALDPEWENLLGAVRAAHQERMWLVVLDLTGALGTSWFRYGRYEDANIAYALAETAAQKLGSNEDLAHTLLRWAEVAIEQSRYDAAWERLETALRLYYEQEDGPGIAKTKYFQGFIQYDQGQYKGAERALIESKSVYNSIDDLANLAFTIEILARLYFAMDETIERASELATEALLMHEKANNGAGRISALRFLANINIRRGLVEEAESLALEAVALCEALNFPAEKCAANYLLLTIYRLLGRPEAAERLAEETIDLCRHLGNRKFEAMVLHEMSVNHLSLDKVEEAKEIIERSLAIYREIEDRVGYGYALRQLGDVYAKMDEPQLGIKAWSEAKEIATHIGHHHLLNQLMKRMSQKSG